ncbi:unnamed protein product, partial [Darwinula stevensoni]
WDCLVPPDGLPDLSHLAIPFDTIEEADKYFQKPGNMMIYVSRNPKDSWVSYYHLSRSFQNFTGTMDDFMEQHIQEIGMWGPHWKHVREHLEMRNEPNVCFLTFESLKKPKKRGTLIVLMTTNPYRQNTIEEIKKIALFLGKDLTQEQVKAVKEEASIERMREKAPVTGDYRWKNLHNEDLTKPFVRDGKVGGWRNELTQEQIEKIDKYIKDYFQDIGLFETHS